MALTLTGVHLESYNGAEGSTSAKLTNRSNQVAANGILTATNTTMQLSFNLTNLPIGLYAIELFKNGVLIGRRSRAFQILDGTESVRDLAGNALDGEFNGTLPSGDGFNGGNFIVEFTINAPPVAKDSAISTNEDTTFTGTLDGDDAEGHPLTFVLNSNGLKGTAFITNANTGAFVYTPNANSNGQDSLTFIVNDGYVDSTVATVSITILPINDSPKFHSQPHGSPNPVELGAIVTFTASGQDVDADPLIISWAFGDGTDATGSTVGHTYASTGTFTAQATLSDGTTDVLSNILKIIVRDPAIDNDLDGVPDTLDPDDDNDGTSDKDELASGTNPLDPNSKPSGTADFDGNGIPDDQDDDSDGDGVSDANEILDGTNPFNSASVQISSFEISRLTARMRFLNPERDAVLVRGIIPDIPADLSLEGLKAVVTIGGIQYEFTLNAKGKSRHPFGVAKFKLPRKKKSSIPGQTTALPFSLRIKRQNLWQAWVDEGVDSNKTVSGVAMPLILEIQLNGRMYRTTITAKLTTKAGKVGKLKY